MKDVIENVILQVNGGTQEPNDRLLDRELFVNTETGYLYYGRSMKSTLSNGLQHSAPPLKINSGFADRAGSLGLEGNNFFIEASGKTAYLGLLKITYDETGQNKETGSTGIYTVETKDSRTIDFKGYMRLISPVVSTPYIQGGGTWVGGGNITIDQLTSGKVILKSGSYGNTLPSTGSEGQIFFKIT